MQTCIQGRKADKYNEMSATQTTNALQLRALHQTKNNRYTVLRELARFV